MKTAALPTALALALLTTVTPAAATVSLVGSPDAVNPCRPYPHDPGAVTSTYCTVKGSANAVAYFLDNATAGNYTTVRELQDGARLLLERVEACVKDAGNATCPANLVQALEDV